MAWLQNLAKTYDSLMTNETLEGIMPLAHNSQRAQVHVIVDEEGEFFSAEIVNKEDAVTTIPVTDDSALRTSKPSPHALHDTLWYTAGDLSLVVDENEQVKNGEKMRTMAFDPYMKNLEQWYVFSDQNKKIKAVFSYLNQKKLATDLIESGILKLKDGFLDGEGKILGINQSKAFVRFSVLLDGELINLWKDKETRDGYIDYVQSKTSEKNSAIDYCYVTGKRAPIARLHSKFIRFPGDSAKLISSNDSTNYTYRGRFTSPEETMGVSEDVTLKAHFALRWLISKYAYKRDGFTVVAWDENGDPVLSPLSGTSKLSEEVDNDYQGQPEDIGFNMKHYFAQIRKSRYQDIQKDVTVMVLDNATPGRLAIQYYKEFSGKEYFSKLEDWHISMAWPRRSTKTVEGEGNGPPLQAPSLMDIIEVAHGTEQGGFLKVDDKLFKPMLSRLLPCVLEGKHLPEDIVRSATRRASLFTAMSPNNWWKCLNVSCALIKKYRNEKFKEGWDVAINYGNDNRNYLYGRLLAVVDEIESSAIYQKDIQGRSSSAKRLLDTFSKRPYRTWTTLYKSAQPYLKTFNEGIQKYYLEIIEEIMGKFKEGDFEDLRALEGVFLLGYFHQNQVFTQKKKSKKLSEKNEPILDDIKEE